jgi:hypothetical protein
MKDCVGPECVPFKVHVSYPAPPHAKLYQRFLGCRVLFEQPACELYYDLSILDQPPQLSHKITAVLLQDTCERLIDRTGTSIGVAATYQMLMKTPGQFQHGTGRQP